MNKNRFCPEAFERVEIHNTGEVFACCPNWNNRYYLGQIKDNSVEEIWNSDRAIELRTRILNNDYSLCDKDRCVYLKSGFPPAMSADYINYKPKMEKYPLAIKFVYDYECNINCSICRDKIKRYPAKELEELNSKIDTLFLPILQHAKILTINAYGDPFGSRHSRLLIKKAAKMYPDLKFDFHTNGILINKTVLDNINITADKIETVRISIHAATKETYGKIVTNGEALFPQITNNLEYLKELRKQNYFKLFIHFVVLPENFKEMPAFVDLAEKYDAIPCFWEFRQGNCSYHNEKNNYIYEESHPLHKELVEVMQSPNLKKYRDFIAPLLDKLIK